MTNFNCVVVLGRAGFRKVWFNLKERLSRSFVETFVRVVDQNNCGVESRFFKLTKQPNIWSKSVNDGYVKKAVGWNYWNTEISGKGFVNILKSFESQRLREIPVIFWDTNIMGKGKAGGYYAVAKGRSVGIFMTWDDCKAQVDGFPNARYKKFASSQEAEAFIEENRGTGAPLKKGITAPTNSQADLTRFTVDDDGYIVIFTDGACTKNGRKAAKAGIGVWFGHDHSLNISEPVVGRQTNNTAEIQAAERAITQAKQNGLNKIKIKTDSQFTINCVTKWIYNWKRNNWRLSSGGEVKNKEDLVKLDDAMRDMEIKWSYVPGHAGIEGNEAADRLAVAGADRSTIELI